jgi:hypothetical protein
MRKNLWSEEEIQLLKDNYSTKHSEELIPLFPNRTKDSIKTKAQWLGLTKEINTREGDVAPLLENSYLAYYWVGFILADGAISDFKRLIVTLSVHDLDHLEKFASFLKTNIRILKDYKSKGSFNSDGMCRISIQDSIKIPLLCQKFDLKPLKTYNPPVLNIKNDDLFISLLAGFIDGDGSIKTNKNRGGNMSISLKNHSSWLNVLSYFEDRVYTALKYKKYKDKSLAHIIGSGYSLLNLTDNSLIKLLKKRVVELNLPIMKRKWDKIDENIISKYERSRFLEEEINNMYFLQNKKPFEIIDTLKIKRATFNCILTRLKNGTSKFQEYKDIANS